jgi:hypothetical protein
MGPCMAISKDKVAGAVLVSVLAAASLGGVGTASATCIGISGINIGDGCSSSFGNFALGLGEDTTANAAGNLTSAIAIGTGTTAGSTGSGSLAYAGGLESEALANGILNTAVAGLGFGGPLGVGTNAFAQSGFLDTDFANLAINLGDAVDGTSTVEADLGAFNLAGNFFGNANSVDGVPTDMTVWSGGSDEDSPGYGNVAANVFGNRNHVQSIGILNNATNWGNEFTFPNGSESTVTAGTVGSPAALSWAFNYQGIFSETCDSNCGNTVNAGPGPAAIAGAIDVIKQTVTQTDPGITIATRLNTSALNTPANTSGLVAGGPSRNQLRPSPNFTPGLTATSNVGKVTSQGGSALGDQITTSTKKLNDQITASAKKINDQITTSVKKVSDNVNRGLSGGAKADPGKKKDSND